MIWSRSVDLVFLIMTQGLPEVAVAAQHLMTQDPWQPDRSIWIYGNNPLGQSWHFEDH